MPGGKVIVHDSAEEHSHFYTHVCRHCEQGVVCSPEIGHNPEECPYEPEITCDDCAGKIIVGTFKFGNRFEDCIKDCDWNRDENFFQHEKQCQHHYSKIYRDVYKKFKKVEGSTEKS